MLFNDMLNNKIRFTRTRRTYNQQRAESVNDIYPAVAYAALEIVLRRKIDRVFIF